MAPRLLPYLHDRPATLERLPEGLDGPDTPHFWQKRTPDFIPITQFIRLCSWLKLVYMYTRLPQCGLSTCT